MAEDGVDRLASMFPPWMKVLGALFLAAALANGAMVWLSLRGHRDLVRPDYYQAGLEQDGRMARRALAASHRIELTAAPDGWCVRLHPRVQEDPGGNGPAEASLTAGSACRVRFFRPEDGREDRVGNLAWVEGAGGGPGRWQGPGIPLRAGHWDVLVEWEKDGKVFMESAFRREVHE